MQERLSVSQRIAQLKESPTKPLEGISWLSAAESDIRKKRSEVSLENEPSARIVSASQSWETPSSEELRRWRIDNSIGPMGQPRP